MEAVRRKKEERDEAKRLHPSTGRKKTTKKQAEQPTGWPLTDQQTGSWKISPTGGDREVHHSPGFKGHAPALQAGWWGPGQRGESRNEREEETRRKKKETAQRQTSSCSRQAQLTGAGRDVLLLSFSRWGDAAACVACAQLRGGAPLQGNLWKAHTHRSGHGGCMLENSGLVLGVDSSLGLLTRLHNPRHVGVALLVHGRLLHLMQKDMGKEREVGRAAKLFSMACKLSFLKNTHYCIDFMFNACFHTKQFAMTHFEIFKHVCWKLTFCTL